jgi:tetratricopeptide (TPR) repeat protein
VLRRLFSTLVHPGTQRDPAVPSEDPLGSARAAFDAGDPTAAAAACETALREHPGNAAALELLGEIALSTGNAARAIALLREGLRAAPTRGTLHLALGRALASQGDDEQALVALEQAQRLMPGVADAWIEAGLAALRQGYLEAAWSKFRRAVAIDPADIRGWINLAIAEQRRGRLAEALANLERAVAVNPQSGLAWSNYGLALRDNERLDEAIDALRRAVSLRPNHVPTLVNLGATLIDDEQFDDAASALGRAVELDPARSEPRVSLAQLAVKRGRPEEADALFRAALAVTPADSKVRGAYGEFCLSQRRFADGWDLYEARHAAEGTSVGRFALPEWDGGELAEGTLVVGAEQGIGDMILFASCVPDALERAPRLVMEAPPKLLRLFERSFPGAAVRPHLGSAYPAWLEEFPDARASIAAGSLMRLFRRSEAAFPAHAGYLRADPERVARWRARLAALGGGPKIGVSWRGGFFRTGRKSRSTELADLRGLVGRPGATFVSLQYTPDAGEEIARLVRETGTVIHHWQEAIDDYEETAALVAALDAVVTVCTAVAHLAGALGRPLYVLAPAVPSWRYLADGATLPWYPAARMLRRRAGEDWAGLADRAVDALRERFGERIGDAVQARVVASSRFASPLQPAAPGPEAHAPDAGTRAFAEASAARRRGEPRSAAEALEHILSERPDWTDAYRELARAYVDLNDRASARDCLALALHHGGGDAETHALAAEIAESEGLLEEALGHADAAVDAAPQRADLLTTVARLRYARAEHQLAQDAARAAIAVEPGRADALQILGLSAVATQDYATAAEALEAAVARVPDLVTAHFNLAGAYIHLGRFAEAEQRLRWVLAREPGNHHARWDYAHLQLAARDFAHGWKNYEARRLVDPSAYPTAHLTPWRGEPLAGKTILVLGEQGLGDEIMFASCVPEVIERAGRTIIACDKRLVTLFRRSFAGAEVRAFHELDKATAATVDFEMLAGSLPLHFRPDEGSFPRHAGYLRADPAAVSTWRDRLEALGPGFKVGLSWRGGTARTRARLRTIPVAQLAPIVQTPVCRFVSLQYGEVGAELAAFRDACGVEVADFPAAHADYEETAALVCALDLVVTVCTSLVHLTGALGRPVWVLVPSVPEWRYCLGGETLPWYPAARLFRQPEGADWRAVVGEVATALRNRAAAVT